MKRSLAAITIAACAMAPFVAMVPAAAEEIPDDVQIDFDAIPGGRDALVCLALNDYWEARGEPLEGRVAVAKVVLNRLADQRYPGTVCEVVGEHKTESLTACQFSWYCDGRPDTPQELAAWRQSLMIASAVLHADAAIDDPSGGALWYHAVSVHPVWADRFDETVQIGNHIFYRDPEMPVEPRGDGVLRLAADIVVPAPEEPPAAPATVSPEALSQEAADDVLMASGEPMSTGQLAGLP